MKNLMLLIATITLYACTTTSENDVEAITEKTTETEYITEIIEEEEPEKIITDTKVILNELGLKWIKLNSDGSQIPEYCMYGIYTVSFDETGSFIEYSEGGDAVNYDIKGMEMNSDRITLKCKNFNEEFNIYIFDWRQDVTIFKIGEEEELYTKEANQSSFYVIKEECD
ncbi:MAG: hypothetical protein P1U41_08510 [Vicingaceae bacterium]|nr:hypothetical protein [Vicingaceae bacterium]